MDFAPCGRKKYLKDKKKQAEKFLRPMRVGSYLTRKINGS